MDIKIEKGIPCPERRAGGRLYPWDAMEVGDSFLIPDCERKRQFGLCSCAKRFGIKITTRRIGNDVRVWRLE